MDQAKLVRLKPEFVDDELFLCRSFSLSIESQRIEEKLAQIKVPLSIVREEDKHINEDSAPQTSSLWKVGDLCLAPYSEDGLFYNATIVEINSPNCRVSFDDYGNEEEQLIDQLKHRTEQVTHQENTETENLTESMDENQQLDVPFVPPTNLPGLSENDDELSSTLISWYLAGYHTGFYQALNKSR